jgi:predicted RecB family nuclease
LKQLTSGVRVSASDLSNFLACRYLTHLDLEAAQGARSAPAKFDLGFLDLVKRGEEHEKAVLQDFVDKGYSVTEIRAAKDDVVDAVNQTIAAIRSGMDVIYQAALTRSGDTGKADLIGRPDFLIRSELLQDGKSGYREGDSPYEVVDAKLARSAKVRALLQITFYSALLSDLLDAQPRRMHLALGTAVESFQVREFAAYERQTRRLLDEFITVGSDGTSVDQLYPEPVEQCAICRWSDECGKKRRGDDDLSLVAGMTAHQRSGMKSVGISTRRHFAATGFLPKLDHVGSEGLRRAQLQARLQVRSEDERKIEYELLPVETDDDGTTLERGLLILPAPAPGDLFFDIEGARYWSDDDKEFGLQYLFGFVDTAELDADGRTAYTQIWAYDRPTEKVAFEAAVDFIVERRNVNPGLHVYHYNHYEPTSIENLSDFHQTRQEIVGNLMGRFATREDEVDELFRQGVFVDLYKAVRQGMRIGVESYSIKRLEPVCGYERQVDLKEASRQLIAFEVALDDGTASSDLTASEVVAGYNEDDCRATLALRDWLEHRRTELETAVGYELPRPRPREKKAPDEDPEVTRIRSSLLASLPKDGAHWSDVDRAKGLLADLLDWHRREAKPQWWHYYYLRSLDDAELVEEPDAIGMLTGGDVVGLVKKSEVRRFYFPAQEHRFSAGDGAVDPVTEKTWTVQALDETTGTIDLKAKADQDPQLPRSIMAGVQIPPTKDLAENLRDLGDRACRGGLTGNDAASSLLLRRRPRCDSNESGPVLLPSEGLSDASLRLCSALDHSYLPTQGPPGTGKTYTGADQILSLVSKGLKVGITGPSHAVIWHFINEVLEHADKVGIELRIGQRADADNPHLHNRATGLSNEKLAAAIAGDELDVAAGTVWFWARHDMAQSVHALFVDEAGQMSLANVLAVAGCANNLVLLGDPQQLAQPSQAAHPPGAGTSPLGHILGDKATIGVDEGVLLDRTWRMHPSLCSYTSEIFYDDRLEGVAGLENQLVLGDGASECGIRFVPVSHQGNANGSPEEAAVVANLVESFLGSSWQDKDRVVRAFTSDDVLVITPFNVQVREIKQTFANAGLAAVRVGTVDKFQGRQAAVSIYSMASSSAEDATRGIEFLYDLHRLNVATSRARGLAVIVASPDLLRVFCRTPRQMQMVNALCRAWETAQRAFTAGGGKQERANGFLWTSENCF